jgi:Undecaprenyl-phosphate glucose phosphotransferase
MDGSLPSRGLRPHLTEQTLSRAQRPRRKLACRTDSLAIGYDLLLLWDFLTVWGSGYLCASAWELFSPGASEPNSDTVFLIAMGAVVAPLLMRDRWSRIASSSIGTAGLMRRTLKRMVVIACVLLALHFATTHSPTRSPPMWFGTWFAAAVVAAMTGRGLFVHAWRRLAAHGLIRDRVAVIGSGAAADWVMAQLGRARGVGVQVVTRMEYRPGDRLALDALVEELVLLGRRGELDRVVLAVSDASRAQLVEVARRLKVLQIEVTSCSPLFESPAQRPRLTQIAGVPLFVVTGRPRYRWGEVAKVIEDRVLAALLILWTAPVLAAVAVAVRLDSPGPVIFRQRRHGVDGTEFEVFKFRTMYWQGSGGGTGEVQTQRGDNRITRVGGILRKTSLDELPQLFNVLFGSMSLVGPRPHPVVMRTGERLGEEIIADYPYRHRVKPGITGWAQINGYRGATETPDQLVKRIQHDLFYIENWSLLFDLRILVLTPLKIAFQRSNAF